MIESKFARANTITEYRNEIFFKASSQTPFIDGVTKSLQREFFLLRENGKKNHSNDESHVIKLVSGWLHCGLINNDLNVNI